MDQGIIGREQIRAGRDCNGRARAFGKAAGFLFQMLRPHVIGGRVDQVAGKMDRLGHGGDEGDIGPGWRLQRREWFLISVAVTVETVPRQLPAEQQACCLLGCERSFQVVSPVRWQTARQVAERPAV